MKDTQGVACITIKKNQKLSVVREYVEGEFVKASRYKSKNLPSAGAVISNEDVMKRSNVTFEGFE
jgi:DNA gyrase subunit A